jgi:hypothetical protein
MSKRLVLAALICLPLAGCDLPETTDPITEAPTLRIADAANNGDQHLYFLPPLAWQPEYSGNFDPTMEPQVSICAVNGAGCGEIAAYSMTAESHGEMLQVNPANEFYHVNWHTNLFDLDLNTVYRIRIMVDGDEVAFLDVLLVENKSKLRSGGRDGTIPLVDGRTAPIKFRIEEGLGGDDPPGDPDPPDPPDVPEGAITGTVTDAAGAGIGGITVSALTTGMVNTVVSQTQTQADGTYVLPVPDTYPQVLVRFEDPNMVYTGECWDNAPLTFCAMGATSVARGTTGINAMLNGSP